MYIDEHKVDTGFYPAECRSGGGVVISDIGHSEIRGISK
jgi:hypothetical protein